MKLMPLVFAGVVLVVMLAFAVLFAKYFRLWLMCLLSGAGIPFPQIIAMRLRNSPVQQICELRIKLKQNGIPVSATELEQAHVRGADIEKLTEAMLHAHRTDRDVSWEQLVETELQSA